jgi:hypothetical protein
LITELLLPSPGKKIENHCGQLTAHPLGFHAVNMTDVAGVPAFATAFPLLIVPPHSPVRPRRSQCFLLQ